MMGIRSAIKTSILWIGSHISHNRGSKILYYHDVYSTANYKALDADIFMGTPLELFKKHIEVIKNEGYEIVRKITRPEGQVALMFDDGFRGIWECRHYFYDHGLCPTVFLPVEFIGRTDLGLLSLDEIKELQNHGFIFQSHTWTHRALTEIPNYELKHELIDSRIELSRLLGTDVTGLCMPLGFFSQDILQYIRDAGYSEIYCCVPGNAADAPYGMISRNIVQYTSPKELGFILRGANNIIKSRYIKLQEH